MKINGWLRNAPKAIKPNLNYLTARLTCSKCQNCTELDIEYFSVSIQLQSSIIITEKTIIADTPLAATNNSTPKMSGLALDLLPV